MVVRPQISQRDVDAEEGEEEEPAAVDEILPDDPPPLDPDEEINGRDVN